MKQQSRSRENVTCDKRSRSHSVLHDDNQTNEVIVRSFFSLQCMVAAFYRTVESLWNGSIACGALRINTTSPARGESVVATCYEYYDYQAIYLLQHLTLSCIVFLEQSRGVRLIVAPSGEWYQPNMNVTCSLALH